MDTPNPSIFCVCPEVFSAGLGRAGAPLVQVCCVYEHNGRDAAAALLATALQMYDALSAWCRYHVAARDESHSSNPEKMLGVSV